MKFYEFAGTSAWIKFETQRMLAELQLKLRLFGRTDITGRDTRDCKQKLDNLTQKLKNLAEMYHVQIQKEIRPGIKNQLIAELTWIENGRPYYNVYPGIVPHLCRLREDKVLVDYIHLPQKAVAFRFSEQETFFNFDWNGKNWKVKSLLAGDFDAYRTDKTFDDRYFAIWMDISEIDAFGFPIFTYKKGVMHPGYTVEQAVNELPPDPSADDGVQIPLEIVDKVFRCVLSCCLISQNKDDGLIEPEVLAKDQEKFDRTGDLTLIEKAKRKGKFGWKVGEHLEVSPHYRGPSPIALYWTGKGRTTPLYRFRRGTIVHRKKIAELPTGYDNEQTS